ncbi:DUF624 domain-containing protein [Fundicoccus culcitae]|uniref:DUF624 domain-containing protein n=1 Tax=Fundicoccus culcitae TaxID=2969821 RepID=A0ABY5P5A1_9LACT|nr:DUF624 domain-containing protein [Fundicoccus culcitae]UUX33751.1 DUF624 domain-containing protein [Fundicoccus culcitae]
MNKFVAKISYLFDYVFYVVSIHFLWFIGLCLGLLVFGLVPSTITTFRLARLIQQDSDLAIAKLLTKWWAFFKDDLAKYWKNSLGFSLGAIVLILNYLYLQQSQGFLLGVVFYVTLILMAFYIIALFWFAYLSANHIELSKFDTLKNAVSIPIVYVLEMIVLVVFLAAWYLLVSQLIPGLNIFSWYGVLCLALNYAFGQIVEGNNLKKLNKLWKRMG